MMSSVGTGVGGAEVGAAVGAALGAAVGAAVWSGLGVDEGGVDRPDRAARLGSGSAAAVPSTTIFALVAGAATADSARSARFTDPVDPPPSSSPIPATA